MKYTNPVLPGFYPDPSICRVGSDYFLVTSSFEYVPGVPLFHSRDLVHWRQIGHCLTRPSQLPLPHHAPSLGIYAPTIRYHNGTFVMITTNLDVLVSGARKSGNFYVTTNDPFGAWSEPIWVDQTGIDPSLFFDDDGRVYLTSTWSPEAGEVVDPDNPGSGVQQSEIDLATGRLLTEPRVIWHGTGGKYPEGPHLYKVEGRYYLMIAEGGTEYGHMETLARSATPWGPWEPCPHNPILTHRSLLSPIQVLGHADWLQAQDGSWWMVCLGVRPQPGTHLHHLGRETFLAPVVWDADGWPHVGEQGRIRLSMDAPRLPEVTWPQPNARDEFDQPELGLAWNFLRHPHPEDWSLTERPGFLRLRGNAARLDDGFGVAFVGRRQQHAACTASALLEFMPDADGQEAGLTVWMNRSHHYDLAVTQLEGQRHILLRQRLGLLSAVVAREPLADGAVRLSIAAAHVQGADIYTFSYTLKDRETHALGRGEARYLASEVAGGFTGVYLALYASANGQPTAPAADFDWFEYQPG